MPDVQVPTSTGRPKREPRTRTAYYANPDAMEDDALDVDPEWRRIPNRVANELGLEHGDKLVVKQRPVMHYEDGKLARGALDEDGYVQEMHLLQRVITKTVTDSNFGIPELRVIPQDDEEFMDAPELAWFLYEWLGALTIAKRLENAGGHVENFKKKSG